MALGQGFIRLQYQDRDEVYRLGLHVPIPITGPSAAKNQAVPVRHFLRSGLVYTLVEVGGPPWILATVADSLNA
ncbi:hypothetical protein ACET3X_000143 [Alternaria dauci]|uniref:Uncharacterized protein n=1 Tax=Alternaria dauci TaxID=48095 RepID=A0ABR3UTM7_9PLEO